MLAIISSKLIGGPLNPSSRMGATGLMILAYIQDGAFDPHGVFPLFEADDMGFRERTRLAIVGGGRAGLEAEVIQAVIGRCGRFSAVSRQARMDAALRHIHANPSRKTRFEALLDYIVGLHIAKTEEEVAGLQASLRGLQAGLGAPSTPS